LKQPIRSAGTLPKSAAEEIGNSTFFAPLSKHTCRAFANSSTFIMVPLMLISPSTANALIVDFPKAMEHSTIKVSPAY
jgi:hypothetical protein